MEIDVQKQMREQVRWLILATLNAGRPMGVNEDMILSAINAVPVLLTRMELRKELDYLEARNLIEIGSRNDPSARWFPKLTRAGIDVVEYTVDCDPGIARPHKWWSDK